MANYLLLRNNKESGPYSLDGLMELGLKPYDLIWVQGRSAAWRYPSEVDELKPIAPAVEEQPFDRFFKKTEEKQEWPVMAEQPVKKEEPLKKAEPRQQEIPVVKPEYEKYIPKKSVYVTLPGQKAAMVTEPVNETPPVAKIQAVKEAIPVAAAAQPTITVSENPVAAQIKYSQPLDEIKEMYVKTLHDRKQKIARKSFWIQNLKKAAVLLSLVAIGIIAGFVIKSNGSKQQGMIKQESLSSSQPVKPEVTAEVPQVNTNPADTTTIGATENVQTLRQPTGGFVNTNPAEENKAAESNKTIKDPPVTSNNNNVKKETPTILGENKAVPGLTAEPVEVDQVTGERNRKVRTRNNQSDNNNTFITEKNTERRPALNENLSRQVFVKSNEYKRVAFGGIRDLELTVFNESKYVLDNVIVELQYIRPNEMPLKTANIQFTSVAPFAASTIRLPDTNRGIKVVFRIIHIKSRQMDEVVTGN